MTKSDERALALAGCLQACYLVVGVARSGLVGQDSLQGTLESIFVTNPEKTIDVYAGGNGVRTGLRLCMEIFADFDFSTHGETLRSALAVINLEKKVARTPELLRSVGAGISAIEQHRNLNALGATEDDVVERLSTLYEETLGKVEPRIRVLGQQKHLQNRANTARIRALLLAALRSAVLWRQLDGHLTQFIFGRGKLLRSVNKAAENIS